VRYQLDADVEDSGRDSALGSCAHELNGDCLLAAGKGQNGSPLHEVGADQVSVAVQVGAEHDQMDGVGDGEESRRVCHQLTTVFVVVRDT